MNLQWGDKGIGWCDATWNPVTGCKSTSAQCAVRDVCYARRISERFGRSFEPTFHPERLEEPYKLKKPAKIFACSMGELFGPWVPREWQEAIIEVAQNNPQHTFQFLTKFPSGYQEFLWPHNAWLGTTVTSDKDSRQLRELWEISIHHDGVLPVVFVSAEPLLGSLYSKILRGINWLIVGAQTNPERQPKRRWVEDLLTIADAYNIPVFMKKNLDCEPKRREFPRGREE